MKRKIKICPHCKREFTTTEVKSGIFCCSACEEGPEIKTVKGTIKLGYVTDMMTEWWTEADWKKHEEYVEELKAKGEYGKEVEITLDFVRNPLFDDPTSKVIAAELDYKLVWLDFSENTKKNDTQKVKTSSDKNRERTGSCT